MDHNAAALYHGADVVLATMHHKERVIAPLLERQLGVRVTVPRELNTDRFGTFTREIARPGSQLDTARKKARAALTLTGAHLALASEGSFGPHPHLPVLQSGLELVLFIDTVRGIEVCGYHRTTDIHVNSVTVSSPSEARAAAEKHGFPKHGLIVRWSPHVRFGIYKELRTMDALEKRVARMLAWPCIRSVTLETDMRAHRNPTRMRAIEKATEDLLERMDSLCPSCGLPGFVAVDYTSGLPCKRCGIPTDMPREDIYHCSACGRTDTYPVTTYGTHADPQYCHHCNP